MLRNELPAFVAKESVDYSNGLGYGSITLSVDGILAFAELTAQLEAAPLSEPKITGIVTIEVKD